MKSTGWVISGLGATALIATALAAATSAATAQALPDQAGRALYRAVSDFDGPYAAMPPEAPLPRRYLRDDDAPGLLPPTEVYSVLRENGFSPLGSPRRRGPFYSIAAIDPNGDDGRLLIDGRDGRILRFTPAYLMDDAAIDDEVDAPRVMPAPRIGRAPPRPMPRLASRTPSVPLPKPPPRAVGGPNPEAKSEPARPAPQQSAAAQRGPAAPEVAAKPSPHILPTQPLPPVQGLD